MTSPKALEPLIGDLVTGPGFSSSLLLTPVTRSTEEIRTDTTVVTRGIPACYESEQ